MPHVTLNAQKPQTLCGARTPSIPRQRECFVDQEKTPSFGLCQVDMYGAGQSKEGNVQFNWPKLFQAFSVILSLICFHNYIHLIIPHQHM